MEDTSHELIQLVLTRPEDYNSGRFIIRYDCGFRGIPIEEEYKSGISSPLIVTRNRTCYVIGEISTVTVWFVNGQNISSQPAVVNIANGAGECNALPILL